MYKQFALLALVVAGAGGTSEAVAMEKNGAKSTELKKAKKELALVLAKSEKRVTYKYPGGPPESPPPQGNDTRKVLSKSKEHYLFFCGSRGSSWGRI